MSESFELETIDQFTAGTVGPKGQRVFYLQAQVGAASLTLRLEKQQVAMLADHLDDMLGRLPSVIATPIGADAALVEPIEPEWIVGSLGVGYDEDRDKVLVWAEELVPEDDSDAEPADSEPATARFHLSREQVAGFVQRAHEVVAAGRPPCPFCARPLDDDDGWCPCQN